MQRKKFKMRDYHNVDKKAGYVHITLQFHSALFFFANSAVICNI